MTMFSFEWPSNAANVVISTSLDSAARVAQVCLKSYSLNSIMRIVDLRHGFVGVFPVGEDAGAFCNLHRNRRSARSSYPAALSCFGFETEGVGPASFRGGQTDKDHF